MNYVKQINLFILLIISCCNLAETNHVLELGEKFLDLYKQDHSRLWLVKFYVPWCHYCKQMEKTYNRVAQVLYDENVRVHVGQLDCTRFPSIAAHFSVKGFPTILLITSKKTVEFLGDRSTPELVDFAKRLAGPPIREVECDDLISLRKKHPMHFIYFGDPLCSNFSEVAKSFQATNWFFHSKSACDKFEANSIYAFKSPSIDHPVVAKYDNNSGESLTKWLVSNRFPHFVKISTGNFNMLLYTGKLLVIAIVKEDESSGKLISSEHDKLRDTLEDIASTFVDEKNLFVFCWATFSDMISSIAISTIIPPDFIIINSTNLEYYMIDGEINTDSILNLLKDLSSDFIISQPHGGDKYYHRLLRIVYDGYTSLGSMYRGNPLLTLLIIGLPFTFLSIIIYTSCYSDILDDKDIDGEDDEDEGKKIENMEGYEKSLSDDKIEAIDHPKKE